MTKKFEITDKSLRVRISNLLGSTEEEITFENISSRPIRKNILPWKTAIPAVIFSLGIIITVIERLSGDKNNTEDILLHAVLFSIFAILTMLNRQYTITLTTLKSQSIEFYSNSPSKSEVEGFLVYLKSTQKEYFLDRYLYDTSLISDEQFIANLNWVYDSGFINQQEFQEFRNEHLRKINADNSDMKINFSSN